MYGVDMSKPGAQAYYDSIVAQYAKWGVDFIKADDMSRPYHKAEIAALHKAILKSGRPIVLSLSPGPAPLDEVEHLRANAQMWRIENDLWDNWKSVKAMYFRAEKWAPLVERGHWPDADMLPLGHIGIRAERGDDRLSLLSHDEQQTLMTFWSIFRSPLMFGGDLATLDSYTRSLLTNADLIAVNQDSTGNKVAYSGLDRSVSAREQEIPSCVQPWRLCRPRPSGLETRRDERSARNDPGHLDRQVRSLVCRSRCPAGCTRLSHLWPHGKVTLESTAKQGLKKCWFGGHHPSAASMRRLWNAREIPLFLHY
jgi:hypothetical protein